ncbi:MAG: agmatine deiminase [Candidatus Omnitrophica bacterium CG11_big_fil_rev_8_21_14_0_20_45_26]|uniref:Agmatine deiminase n=1 Tax=Candidatus Abzuiibacterium crystallinum TaxID=1974748 RepID=A0A2H0LQ85_9BACT|nr:MAG: agmatine deiminase [Candidatus Omnitrophica bacterium CG11_big_fil_rev_8_21_14_0_20_45_26]PIW63982.1 MAG: agmatine deiminase [Candidatus Omnitrophica bacterium CG12_big_fil_rev_8_21_14_0_65_45_16]
MNQPSRFAPSFQPQATPLTLNYRLPAEWETHEATWLAWPHQEDNWHDLEAVQDIFLEIIQLISVNEKICLLVNDAESEQIVKQQLINRRVLMTQIKFLRIPTCDVWMRDYGPNFLVKSGQSSQNKLAANRWIFNAWGGKYDTHRLDDLASQAIIQALGIQTFETGMILEGGSIDGNGDGTLLTTEQCLLNPNRNASFTREQIELRLKYFLAARHMIWLGTGIAGDDTDGHVDDIARFVGLRTVICMTEQDPLHPNYKPLQDNLQRLRLAKDANGEELHVIELPMPESIRPASKWQADWPQGPRFLPASYANFYIANRTVLVPIFGDSFDEHALGILQKVFPDRKVRGIRADELIYGLGGIHCVTHEQPAIP